MVTTAAVGNMVDKGTETVFTRGMEATTTERSALKEMVNLLSEARGDHEALADVRRQIVAEMDALTTVLSSAGVNVDALLDDIDEELAR